jgi:hypothetical protein
MLNLYAYAERPDPPAARLLVMVPAESGIQGLSGGWGRESKDGFWRGESVGPEKEDELWWL